MDMFFKVSFVVATVLDLAVLTALLRQGIQGGSRSPAPPGQPDPAGPAGPTGPAIRGRRPVLRTDEAFSAAGFFGAAMIATTLAAHGWDALELYDTVLFAVVFAILTAALIERLRPRPATLALAPYAIPVAYGVLAGLAGPGL